MHDSQHRKHAQTIEECLHNLCSGNNDPERNGAAVVQMVNSLVVLTVDLLGTEPARQERFKSRVHDYNTACVTHFEETANSVADFVTTFNALKQQVDEFQHSYLERGEALVGRYNDMSKV